MRHSGLLGFRLAKGLHLGHLVGNLKPAIKTQGDQTIHVILADLLTATSSRSSEITVGNLLAVMADCIASGLSSENVVFMRQSRIASEIGWVYWLIATQIRHNRLIRTPPIRKMVMQKHVTVAETFFPIIQIGEMLGLRTTHFYSNVDNLGLVELGNQAIKALNRSLDSTYPTIQLVHGDVPTILGLDGNKMSYSNRNALLLTANDLSIRSYFSRMRTDKAEAKFDKSLAADHSLVFTYGKIFGMPDSEISELHRQYESGLTTSLEIKNVVADYCIKILEPIRFGRTNLIEEEGELLWERLNDETNAAIKLMRANLDPVVLANFAGA